MGEGQQIERFYLPSLPARDRRHQRRSHGGPYDCELDGGHFLPSTTFNFRLVPTEQSLMKEDGGGGGTWREDASSRAHAWSLTEL